MFIGTYRKKDHLPTISIEKVDLKIVKLKSVLNLDEIMIFKRSKNQSPTNRANRGGRSEDTRICRPKTVRRNNCIKFE